MKKRIFKTLAILLSENAVIVQEGAALCCERIVPVSEVIVRSNRTFEVSKHTNNGLNTRVSKDFIFSKRICLFFLNLNSHYSNQLVRIVIHH